jgi:hypothetical protein
VRATPVAAKAVLVDRLGAWPALAGVLVAWSPPAHLPRERERIFLDDVRDFRRSSEYQSGSRTETYTIAALIEVHQAVAEQQPVETRVWELLDAVEDAVEADPELDGVVHRARLDGADGFEAGPTDQGWLVRVAALIGVRVEV